MYFLQRGWIDTAGKCRTWTLHSPNGAKVAEVTTKRAALLLLELLNA